MVYQYPDSFEKDIAARKEGDWLRVALSKPRKPKTPKQLGYYFVTVLPVIHSQMVDDGWTESVIINTPQKQFKYEKSWTKEATDKFLKDQYASGQSKAAMSSEQASEFLTKCIEFGNYSLGCQIPKPKKMEKSNVRS